MNSATSKSKSQRSVSPAKKEKKSPEDSSASSLKTSLDMGWGNPEYLFQIWNHLPQETTMNTLPGKYQFSGTEELKKKILELHKKVHGLKEGYEVVIGNGATQILQAAIWAHGEASKDGPARVFAEAPYYPRFPTLTSFALGQWTKHNDVEIVTSPNNPTGRLQKKTKNNQTIYDFSYNWPQYTKTLEPLNKNIMIFSLGKMSGHVDMRIGWALIKKSSTKKQMESFIEYSSNGVSKQAQDAAGEIIDVVSDYHEDFFSGASSKLEGRWDQVKEIKPKLPFSVLNSNGMFLFCKGKCPKEITYTSGLDMGVTSDFFRLNIGCSDDTFEQFIEMYK